VKRLTKASRSLKRIHNLIGLPARLEFLIEDGSYKEAAEEYLCAKPRLVKYGHISAIRNIDEVCTKHMDGLKSKVRISKIPTGFKPNSNFGR
jgi:hypothetical protein